LTLTVEGIVLTDDRASGVFTKWLRSRKEGEITPIHDHGKDTSNIKTTFFCAITYKPTCCTDASTKRPLPVLILPFKTSLNDFIPDNHEFQVKTTLV
jgi:hypothetical protein